MSILNKHMGACTYTYMETCFTIFLLLNIQVIADFVLVTHSPINVLAIITVHILFPHVIL
jgi:hypothetical protein